MPLPRLGFVARGPAQDHGGLRTGVRRLPRSRPVPPWGCVLRKSRHSRGLRSRRPQCPEQARRQTDRCVREFELCCAGGAVGRAFSLPIVALVRALESLVPGTQPQSLERAPGSYPRRLVVATTLRPSALYSTVRRVTRTLRSFRATPRVTPGPGCHDRRGFICYRTVAASTLLAANTDGDRAPASRVDHRDAGAGHLRLGSPLDAQGSPPSRSEDRAAGSSHPQVTNASTQASALCRRRLGDRIHVTPAAGTEPRESAAVRGSPRPAGRPTST